MRNLQTLKFCLSALMTWMLLTAATSGQGAAKKITPAQPHGSAPEPRVPPFVSALKPLPSGPGIVIGEPVSRPGVDPGVSAFGSGCARWLQFALNSQSEIGKSPRLDEIQRAGVELGRPNHQFLAQDVSSLYSKIGVTHVAVCEIGGTHAACKLSLQVYVAPGRSKVGSPIVIAGTEDHILVELPRAARRICGKLGVPAAGVPVSVGASSTELQTIGQAFWPSSDNSTASINSSLDSLADRIPLAAIWLIATNSIRSDDARYASLVKNVVASEPGNPEVLGEIGAKGPGLTAYQNLAAAQLHRHPNNYLVAIAVERLQRELFHRDQDIAAAKHLVQCNTKCPSSWIILSNAYDESAQNIRQSRFASQISDQEWTMLSEKYASTAASAQHAVVLDPSFGRAWFQLSSSATFAGANDIADKAFWMAVKLDRDEIASVYWWGMQMYQPKWLDNPDKLAMVGRKAIAYQSQHPEATASIAKSLIRIGMKDEADKMLAVRHAKLDELVSKDPNNGDLHLELAEIDDDQHDAIGALNEARKCVALNPNSAEWHIYLASLWKRSHIYLSAKSEYEEALRLQPWNTDVQADLAALPK